MLKSYVRVALRNIFKKKLFAFINILGLAVGMACFVLIALWVWDELSYDKFHANRNELFLLTIKHPDDNIDPNVPYALAPRMAAEFPEIKDYSRIVSIGKMMTCSFLYQPENGSKVVFYENRVNLVDPCFFAMFSFPFIHGSAETALLNRDALVISEDIAKKYFGEENPLGQKLTFNNRVDLVVSGVIRIPSNSHLQFDFVSRLEDPKMDDWNWRDPSYVLLNKDVPVDGLREKIGGALNRYYPHPLPSDDFTVGLMPVSKVHLDFGRKAYIYVFTVVAVFILLIACINYMNLATARSSHRAREVGMRKIVGAKRSQLVGQFLGESVWMSFFASLLALLLTRISLPLLNNLTSKQLSLFAHQNSFLIFLLPGLSLFVGILSGLYPSFFLASSKPVETIRASGAFKMNRSLFRIVSVTGQFTVSVLLIACTGVVFKQLNYMQKKPLGFQTDYVIKMPLNASLRSRFESFRNELKRNSNVLFVTASQGIPYDDDYKTGGVEWEGKDPVLVPNIRYSISQFDYPETFGMEVVEGRSFSRQFPADRYNYMINEEAARYMDLDSPVGTRLKFWGREGQIIGVVKDFHHVSLHRDILPQVFSIHPALYGALKYVSIKIRSEAVPDTLREIKNITEKFAPQFPFDYSFLDEGIGNLYVSEQRLGKIFGYFAFIAIMISCLGIFGLAAYTAEQRTKEIGIRKVLGSSVSGIVLLLSKELSRWILLANVLAWPVAFFLMKKWLQNFAYRTEMGVGLFLLAGFLSILIALLSVSYQSIRAAMSDPVKSLKYE